MAVIALGRIDKKFFLVIIWVIFESIDLVIYLKAYESNTNSNGKLSKIEKELGPIILGLVLYLIIKKKESKKNNTHKSYKHLIYLFLLKLAEGCNDYIFTYFVEWNYDLINIYFTDNGLKLILVTFVTAFLLKYRYYIHHLITLIIYVVLGICSDFILENYSQVNFSYVYIYIIYLLVYAFIFCYIKYMIDKHSYHYVEIMIYKGIIGVIVKIILFAVLSIYENKINENNGYKDIFGDISDYFHETSVVIIIFYQILYFLFYGAIESLIEFLIIYYLMPNHLFISYNIYIYFFLLAFNDYVSYKIILVLIVLCLQIFTLLFHYEILELNFCGLSKNTRKNIQLREKADVASSRSKSFEGTIELIEQYYFEM